MPGELPGAPGAARCTRGAADKQCSYGAIEQFLGTQPDAPERLDAVRLAADLLDLPPETQAGLAPPRTGARTAGVISPRLLDAGMRLERGALAGVAAHPDLVPRPRGAAARSTSTTSCTGARASHLLGEEPADGELTALLAELYAQADEDEHRRPRPPSSSCCGCGNGGSSASSQTRSEDRMVDLQQALLQIRTAIREFA